MDAPIILNTLKNLGLNSYEAKIYVTLLERHTLTVPEISRLAEIPRPSAYEALDKLMSKGICTSKPGKTKKYSASDPTLLQEKFFAEADKSMETHLQELENSFKQKQEEILQKNSSLKQNISNLTKELRPQYENSRLETNPLDYIEIIKDPFQISKRFMQLVGEAKEEILVFTKPPFSRPHEKLNEQVDQETEILKRRIQGRCIYEIPTDEEEKRWWFKFIKRAVTAGEQARVLDDLPMKMAIFDSKIVLFALADPVSKQISLTSQIVEHPALAKSLKILFETLWAQAQDYHILKD